MSRSNTGREEICLRSRRESQLQIIPTKILFSWILLNSSHSPRHLIDQAKKDMQGWEAKQFWWLDFRIFSRRCSMNIRKSCTLKYLTRKDQIAAKIHNAEGRSVGQLKTTPKDHHGKIHSAGGRTTTVCGHGKSRNQDAMDLTRQRESFSTGEYILQLVTF